MIYLYSGTPGSGKSLHMARDIMVKLKRKHGVIANFPINTNKLKKGIFRKPGFGKFTYIDNSELTADFLKEYAYKHHKIGKEGQTLVCIDECQVIFNAREFSRKDRMEWVKFFSQHRKLGYNIILISQNDRMIDRQIRCLIEYEYKHRKANCFGFIGMLIPVPLFVSVIYWYGIREKIGTEFFTYRKKLSTLYDSYALFDGQEQLNMRKSHTDSGEESGNAGGDTLSVGDKKKHKSLILSFLKETLKSTTEY